MKIILLGDTHFDVSNGSEDVYNQQIKVCKEQIFPFMEENNINTILQLGDFTDNRTKIGLLSQHNLKKDIFEVLKEKDWNLITLIGNHDIYYRNRLDVYSLEVFEKAYPNNLTVYKEPTLTDFGLVVPWLANDELKDKMNKLLLDKPEVVFGHFELKDFYVSKTFKATHGLDKNIFKDSKVFSGHYHNKQSDSNIHYIGTPYQDNWSSYGEKRGFYIYDTETKEAQFIENTVSTKHIKVYLDSVEKTMEATDGITSKKYKIGAKTDYSIFQNQKLKIMLDKDNAFNKKVLNKIFEYCLSYKVDIMEIIDEEDNKEEKVYEFNIEKHISECLETDYQKTVYNDILTKSLSDMKDF